MNNLANKFKIKALWPCFLIFLLIVMAFWDLPRGYFQQDEWHTFGRYIQLASVSGREFWASVLQTGAFSHFTPLSFLFKMWIFQNFALNANTYFVISIILHLFVSLAVYYLVFILTRNKISAAIGAVFFAINSSTHQAVTWLGNFEGTEGAALFGILSIIFWISYFHSKRKIFGVLAFINVLISLLFKEVALSFIFLMALIAIQFNGLKNIVRSIFPIFFVVLLYFLMRNVNFFFGNQEVVDTAAQSSSNFFGPLIYNLSTLPLKILPQIIIPQQLIISISNAVSNNFFPPFVHFRGPWKEFSFICFDITTLILGAVFIKFLVVIYRKITDKKVLTLGLAMVLFGIIPLLSLKQYLVYIDSRYLYIPAIGASVIVGVVINFYGQITNNLAKRALILGMCIIIFANFTILKLTINGLVWEGGIRQQIIQQILSQHPVLSEKSVFYIESTSSYYGLPPEEKILPFQSGFGGVLLVAYQAKENFPLQYFKNDFLWPISSQGYQEVNGRGFGFYRDLGALQSAIKEHNIPYENVIAYKWKARNLNLIDITDEFRKEQKLR